jgi:hypothetical protein
MRRSFPLPLPHRRPRKAKRNDWATIGTLLPYLWVYKWRVMAALGAA